jgi:Icc-related predicted phosphoesterase
MGSSPATKRHRTNPLASASGVGKGKRPITGADEALRHKRTRQVIETAMRQGGAPLVVVTHHAPHPSCLPAAHRTGWLAGNSASDFSQLTDSGRVALWVQGHIHDSVDLRRPGGTGFFATRPARIFPIRIAGRTGS